LDRLFLKLDDPIYASPPFFFTSYVPEYVLDSNLIFTLQLLNMTRQFFIGSNWKMNSSAVQIKRLVESDPCPCQHRQV
jgi:hypothetical protein